MADAEKVLDYAEDILDKPEAIQQLLNALEKRPEIKDAAQKIKSLLDGAANAKEEGSVPSDVEDALDENLADSWLKLSMAINQGVENITSGLRKVAGLNPQMAALGSALVAMTVASSDPTAARSIMKMAGSIVSNDSAGFIENATDVATDLLGESKVKFEDRIAEAVMDLLDEEYFDEAVGDTPQKVESLVRNLLTKLKNNPSEFLKAVEQAKNGSIPITGFDNMPDEFKELALKKFNNAARTKEFLAAQVVQVTKQEKKPPEQAAQQILKVVAPEKANDEKTVKALAQTVEPDASKIATDVDLSYAEKTYGSALAPLKLSEPKIKVVYKLIAVGKLLTDKTIEDLKAQRAKEQVNENFSKRLQNFKNLINPPYIGGQIFVANAQKFFNKDEMALVMSFTPEEVKSINDAVSKVDSQLENNPEVKDNAAAIVAAVNNKANPDKPPEEKKDAVDNIADKLEVEEPEVIEKAKEMVAGQPEGETGEPDLAKEKYGKSLEEFVKDDETMKAVLKFFNILMKVGVLKEGALVDLVKDKVMDPKTLKDALKQLDKNERNLVIRSMNNNYDQFKAMLSAEPEAASEPEEKEDSGEDKSIGDFDPQELMNSIIVFVGKHSAGKPPTAVGEAPQPGSRPNFFYPHDNMLSTQSEILHSLYSQMRKILKLDPEDLSREMRAFNDESATAPDKTEPAGEEQPAPEPQSEGLVREQKFDPKRVGPENFVSLRNYIQDTLEAVEQYKQVTLKGQKGSTALFNKYKSQIGTDAQNPKEVLYKILLPNVVNLANALAARIEFEMKKRTKGKEKEAQQDTPPEGEEQDQQVQKESLMESAGDEYLKKVQTIKAVFEKIIDLAPRLHDTLKQITGEDLKPIKDIRTASQNIYSELEKIREFFPLTKPFKSELHGSQGFDDAVSRTSALLQTVNRALVPVSTFDSFEDMKTASLKPILAALDTVVDTIKEIFSGEFDKRPSYNDETDYEDHKQAMKKDAPDDSDSPDEEDSNQQAKDELDDQTLQMVEDLEVQLATYSNFYETLKAFMIALDSGVAVKEVKSLIQFLMQSNAGKMKKGEQTIQRIKSRLNTYKRKFDRLEDRTINAANDPRTLKTNFGKLARLYTSVFNKSTRQLDERSYATGLGGMENRKELDRLYELIAEYIALYEAVEVMVKEKLKDYGMTLVKQKSLISIYKRDLGLKAREINTLIKQEVGEGEDAQSLGQMILKSIDGASVNSLEYVKKFVEKEQKRYDMMKALKKSIAEEDTLEFLKDKIDQMGLSKSFLKLNEAEGDEETARLDSPGRSGDIEMADSSDPSVLKFREAVDKYLETYEKIEDISKSDEEELKMDIEDMFVEYDTAMNTIREFSRKILKGQKISDEESDEDTGEGGIKMPAPPKTSGPAEEIESETRNQLKEKYAELVKNYNMTPDEEEALYQFAVIMDKLFGADQLMEAEEEESGDIESYTPTGSEEDERKARQSRDDTEGISSFARRLAGKEYEPQKLLGQLYKIKIGEKSIYDHLKGIRMKNKNFFKDFSKAAGVTTGKLSGPIGDDESKDKLARAISQELPQAVKNVVDAEDQEEAIEREVDRITQSVAPKVGIEPEQVEPEVKKDIEAEIEQEESATDDSGKDKKRMTNDDLTSKTESLESKGYTIDDLMEKLRELQESGDKVFFKYTKGDEQKSLIMLRLRDPDEGPSLGLKVKDESDDKEYDVGRDELFDYLEDPNKVSSRGTTLSIELEEEDVPETSPIYNEEILAKLDETAKKYGLSGEYLEKVSGDLKAIDDEGLEADHRKPILNLFDQFIEGISTADKNEIPDIDKNKYDEIYDLFDELLKKAKGTEGYSDLKVERLYPGESDFVPGKHQGAEQQDFGQSMTDKIVAIEKIGLTGGPDAREAEVIVGK